MSDPTHDAAGVHECDGTCVPAEVAVNEEARPDAVLTLVDSDGREWLCAAYVGELERYEGKHVAERRSIHTVHSEPMALRDFKVIQP